MDEDDLEKFFQDSEPEPEEAPPISDVEDVVDAHAVHLPGESSVDDLFGDMDDSPPSGRTLTRIHRRPKTKKKKSKRKAKNVAKIKSQKSKKRMRKSTPESGSGSGSGSGSESPPPSNEEAEEGPKDDPSIGERPLTVRAHKIVTLSPPRFIFKTMDKSRMEFVFVGELAFELLCPLHTFQVQVRPDEREEGCFFVMDVIKVTNGPIPASVKAAEAKAKAMASSDVPAPVINVTLAMLKGAISRSGFLEHMDKKSVYISKCFERVAQMFGKNALSREHIEQMIPPTGNGLINCVTRNALRDAKFFMRANLVGGNAARMIPDDDSIWDIVTGTEILEDDDDGEKTLAILKRVHFLNTLSQWRSDRLHDLLGGAISPEFEDKVECVVRAAGIYHRISNAPNPHNAFVWGDAHDTWPHYMRQVLSEHGIHTARNAGQRWFACSNETREYHEEVTRCVEKDTLFFIRAEEDDDHEAPEGGYVNKLRDVLKVASPKMVVVTTTEARESYLKYICAGLNALVVRARIMGPRTITPGDVVWVDRAHQIDQNTLMRFIRTLSDDAKAIYIAGSIWAQCTRIQPTIFSQLYHDAPRERQLCISGSLPYYKAALVGQDPLENSDKIQPSIRLITRDKGLPVPPEFAQTFKHSRVVSIDDLANSLEYDCREGAIILYDSNWTQEHLAVVWQCTHPKDESIWVSGGQDWRPALRRSVKFI